MGLISRLVGGRYGAIALTVVLLLASPLFAPQLLAFPHKAYSGDSVVWSERPINQVALDRVIARSETLVAASSLVGDSEGRRIFLTDGGWRWLWLANVARNSFALTRPLTDPVVLVHRSDVAADRVVNAAGRERRLSAVIAHEATHGMLRRHFGRVAMAGKPQWLVEGYADHVARESTLTAAEADALERQGRDDPALVYFRGRQRVERELAANGRSVDALFAAH